MLQNPRKTLGFMKNMVYKIPPGGKVNHIQPVAYIISCLQLIRYTSTKLARGQGDVRRKRPNVTSAPRCSTFFWNFKENKYQYL